MLKKSWITEKPSPFYACGYHFRIFIIDEGKEEESFFINVEKGCNTVVTEYGQFYFDPNKISKFKDKFKKPITKRIHFDTCQEGRNYLKSLDNDDNLLIYLKPRWLKYDGEFRFYVNCDNTQFSSPEAQRCLNNVKNRIAIKFPAEKFYIEQSGYSKTQILVTMKCNNDLYNEFDLYDIEWTWSEYSPNLTVLFKSKK